ncbi:MAG: hypothetical protein ACFFCW_43630 [Candidatus Hodarchaeota archaeon]
MYHRIYARLIRARDSTPVADQLIKLDVKGMVYTLTWNGTGYVKQALELETIGGQATTYQVKATFDGTNPQTRSLTITDPYGEEYAVCTTIQYGYKPSSNSASLTVEPPKTDVTAPTGDEPPTQSPDGTTVALPPPKTPEQLKQEARTSGWLTTWHEFTWWYPWYRLHVKISINPTIEIAFNPILPGVETWFWDGLEFFEGLTAEMVQDVVLDIVGLFAAYFVARKTSIANPLLGAALEFIKLGIQAGFLYISDRATKGIRLLGASIGSILMALLAIKVDIAKAFVNALIRLCKWVASAMMYLFNVLMDVLKVEQLINRWWIDAIEVGGDFLIGGLGI